jgi:hypothetical protein
VTRRNLDEDGFPVARQNLILNCFLFKGMDCRYMYIQLCWQNRPHPISLELPLSEGHTFTESFEKKESAAISQRRGVGSLHDVHCLGTPNLSFRAGTNFNSDDN